MFRDGIKALLGDGSSIKIVGEASTGQRAINLLGRVRPDIVLMDTLTPDLAGDEATERIRAIDPHVQVVIVSLDENELMVSRCLQAGAVGFVGSANRPPELREAIDTAFLRCVPRNFARPERRIKHDVRCAAVAIAVSICLGGGVADAQDPHNGFFLTSPLGLSSGWDQNFVSGGQPLNDTEALLTGPTFAWMKSTNTTDFSLDYQPEFELFAHNSNLDAWNHQSRMRLVHRLNGRTTIDVGNYFISTDDPTRVLGNSLLLLPLARFEQNSFYAALNYRVDHHTKLIFRAENTVTNSNGITGPYAGRLNELGTAGTVSVEHKFNSSHELDGSYSFLHVDPLSSAISGGATNVNLFNAAYTYTIHPDLLLHLSAGSVVGTQSAMLGSAAIEKRVKGVWFAGGYQRYVAFFGGYAPLESMPVGAAGFSQGLVASNVYQVATARAWGQITKRVGVEAGAQGGLTGINLLGQNIRGAIYHARVDYRFNDRVVWFARAEYYDQNVAEFIPFANTRRRYTSGIEIALTRSPESTPGRSRRGPLAPDDDPLDRELRVPQDR